MPQGIETIALSLPYRMGSVNCYLVKTDSGHILIDTGCSKRRAELERRLDRSGCGRGNLRLILLTHGDFDHAGNASYLREKLDTRIAMHRGDSGMVERGDLFYGRRKGNSIIRKVAPVLFGFGRSERFSPDEYLDDGYDLSGYGFDGRILHIPGHSKGSIGILTADGDLFCGDLFTNDDRPVLNSIMDDPAAANASVERLGSLGIGAVFPGHGKAFAMREFTGSSG